MALFESSNPTLSQKIFDKSHAIEAEMNGTMSVRGTMNKFGFLMLMVVGGAAYSWHLFDPMTISSFYTVMMVGVFGGFIVAIAMSFKPDWARFLAPVYGLLEGLALGGISAVVNQQFGKSYPGIVTQAVGLTFGVAFAMFLLYNFRVIKATERLKSIVSTAILGIVIFYFIYWILSFFGVSMSVMSWNDGSPLGIGISLFIIAIAALRLVIDFDMIEQGAAQGAPKYMEWYCAFGLLVTIVWLYIEILKLLSRLASRRN